MTHDDLVEIGVRWLRRQNCGVVFGDKFQPVTINGELPDAIGFRQGISILIECKVSRADFLKDKKKPVRRMPLTGMGDWRFMMCPKDMVHWRELPEGWGLLEVYDSGRVKKTHGVPPNSRWWCDRPFKGNQVAEKQMMYSALRRLTLKKCFDRIYEPINMDDFKQKVKT